MRHSGCVCSLTPLLRSCAPQIVFYEGRCFTGRRLEVYGDCDNFQDRGFMNRVNSIRVESGAWICFDHPDFKGQQFILERGEYPEFPRWNSHNDHMGSCRPIRCGLMFRWVMYEEPNFRGRMYIVERGNYCSHNEWQAQNPNIQSIRRIVNYF
ncbi:gamma-crystallin N-B-like [Sinocyclocheilus rhinocerous]|uniref:gamma-crystallin N-B-like n=1 Tax=Sinocyclocheilus rhinocerous TaxID=307959 RepID=UPI0007B84888|nr:PREDICTED: gamma-crystallin N-B-like [Sinocyclocheilus rhinocerous]